MILHIATIKSPFMKKFVTLLLFLAVACAGLRGQGKGFVVLGDLHIDRFEDHDMDYVRTRPQDFAQITKEYPYYTAAYMPKLLEAVRERTVAGEPEIVAVVQLGDLMQGVAGNDRLSRNMARHAVDMLYDSGVAAPWLVVKGNHDVSASPGQPEAWREVVEPFVERQIGCRTDESMYTWSSGGDFQFFALDQFFSPDRMRPESDILDFLRRELPASQAKYKFLLTHQPVIPVTERCWHLFAGIRRPLPDAVADSLRSELLDLLARYEVTVLCAHLHKYSKIVRRTSSGPVVQIMFNSVVSADATPSDAKVSTCFPGTKSFDEKWQPSTNDRRRKILAREAAFIESYSGDSRAGYGVISTESGKLVMRFYAGFSVEPCDEWVLSDVYRP